MNEQINAIASVLDTYCRDEITFSIEHHDCALALLNQFASLIQKYPKNETQKKSLSFSVEAKESLYFLKFNDDKYCTGISYNNETTSLEIIHNLFKAYFKGKLSITLSCDKMKLLGTTAC